MSSYFFKNLPEGDYSLYFDIGGVKFTPLNNLFRITKGHRTTLLEITPPNSKSLIPIPASLYLNNYEFDSNRYIHNGFLINASLPEAVVDFINFRTDYSFKSDLYFFAAYDKLNNNLQKLLITNLETYFDPFIVTYLDSELKELSMKICAVRKFKYKFSLPKHYKELINLFVYEFMHCNDIIHIASNSDNTPENIFKNFITLFNPFQNNGDSN